MSVRAVRLGPLDLIQLGLLGVRTRRMRAALSALGIAIGVATMVLVTAIPAASGRALADQLAALGTNLLRVQPIPNQDPPVLLPAQAVAMTGRIGPVEQVSAVANTHATVRRSNRIDPADTSGITVLASRTDLLPALNASVRSGRFLSAATEKFPAAVLGYIAASRLGIVRLTPGVAAPLITVGDTTFAVIGILDPIPLAADIDQAVLVGWDAARSELGFDGHPTVIYVRSAESSVEDVRAVLPATVDPQEPGLVQVSRPSDALAAKRAAATAFSSLFLGLAAVALLVGGVGVANTMVVSVLERRREIGLRRALGASRGQIRGQFLTESVVLSFLGGATGTLTGILATAAYTYHHGWPLVIPAGTLLASTGAAMLIGVLAGIYPSMRAAGLPPTEALASA
jgi:putative ABC transport system permease protein